MRSPGIPAWDDVDPAMKPVLARQMEVYAGYLENTDYHVGLLIDALEDLEILDDTLIYVIIGDNGASAEGSLQGTFNEMITLGGFGELETPEFLTAHIDEFGGPEAYNHYAVGWAHAMDTPYQWTKQVASHWGGTRNGTIVHWPRGIQAKGEIRTQFHHVIDVAPTVLEAGRACRSRRSVNGVQQKPIEGVSMVYSFDDADAAERHETQYFEMFGNRGIYHKGWTAVTKHRTPWETGAEVKTPAFDDDVWELYDTTTDWTQAHDLAAEHPEKLHELQRLWLIEAVKYNVVPLDDRFAERGAARDRPGGRRWSRASGSCCSRGMGRLTENSVVWFKNTSYALTAEVDVPESGAEGVIVAQGGVTGGLSLYAKDGKPKYCYNFFGLSATTSRARRTIPPGDAPGADGVRLRRRWRRQGRHGHALHRRRRGRRRPHRADRGLPLLGRRDHGRRQRVRLAGDHRLRRPQVQRRGQLGRDRRRPRRPQPPDPPEDRLHLAMAIQ